MLKTYLMGAFLGLAGFSVQAAQITLTNFYLSWNGSTEQKAGGSATVFYDGDHDGVKNQSFLVAVGPYNPYMNGFGYSEDWLTPIAGSGIDFVPVKVNAVLTDISGYVFQTSIGDGVQFGYLQGPDWGFGGGGLQFFGPNALWDITDASNVPEPGSTALILLGLAGLATRRLKNQ